MVNPRFPVYTFRNMTSGALAPFESFLSSSGPEARMQEIWIPEFLLTLFLFLHIIRPHIKALAPMTGLTWLPLVALIITILLFPAYGFRPELIPLLVYAAILTVAGISGKEKDNALFGRIQKTRIILVFPPLVFLALTAGIAFYFTPEKDPAYITEGVYSEKIEYEKTEYFIRIYTDENKIFSQKRPLLILIPPVFGSIAATDKISGELRDRGFTVLSYSRRGFDSPAIYLSKRYGINPFEWYRRFSAFFRGNTSARANARGRALEEAREEDILTLLSWIRQNPRLEDGTALFSIASRDAVFLAGYDAGGSALLLTSNSFQDVSLNLQSGAGQIKIRGIIAIESYLWSLCQEEISGLPVLPPEADWLTSVQHGLNRWYLEMKQKKITGLTQIPRLSFPLLFLISDRGREPDSRYLAAFKTFEASRGPAVFISADGAGLFDYSDFPARYPLLTAIFRGRNKSAWNSPDAPAGTAEIIAGFAAMILKNETKTGLQFENTAFPAGISIAPNREWPPQHD